MKPNTIYTGHCLQVLKTFADNSIDCCVTSPPYWGLRDYGHDAQIGMEETPQLFIQSLTEIFAEVKRVLKPSGTLWLNLGDTYSAHKDSKSISDSLKVDGKSEKANVIDKGKSNSRNTKLLKSVGLKNKDLIGIPWMVAFALRESGWYLRQDIIWAKPNPMPESVTDRCTKAHEYIFLMTKSAKYYYDAEAIKTESLEPEDYRVSRGNKKRTPTKKISGIRNSGIYAKANKRSVWQVTTHPYTEAHFATYPQELIVDCIKAGTSENGNCSKCGKPTERILETIGTAKLKNGHQKKAKHLIKEHRGESSLKTSMHHTNTIPIKQSIGWAKTCNCDAETTPAIVLDPFSGSGTTAIVAAKLGRNYIGIELNPDYVKLSEKRIQKELGLFKPQTP